MSVDANEPLRVGRDLDAAVAEKVMGWTFILDTEPFVYHANRGGCITTSGTMIFRDGNRVMPHDWRPSTNINDAMDVLCKARGPDRCYFRIEPTERLPGHYACLIGGVKATGEWISEAICRAALLAAD